MSGHVLLYLLVAVIGCPVVAACTIPSNVASCTSCCGMRFVVIPVKTRISFDGDKLAPGDLDSLFCAFARWCQH